MGKKLSIHHIPRFQQGGMIWRDNVYSSPANTSQVLQIIGTPEATGYEQNLQNIELQFKARQQNFAEIDTIIKTQLYQKEHEARIKQLEIDNTNNLLKQRATYRDKITNDVLDPTFNDRITALQEKYKINGDYALNMDGVVEHQKNIEAYFNDPEYRSIKAYSTLFTTAQKRAETVQDTLNKWKLENPESYNDYELAGYQQKLQAVRAALVNTGVNPGEPITHESMLPLKQALSTLDSFNIELTKEAQDDIKVTKEIKRQDEKMKVTLNGLKASQLEFKINIEKERAQLFNEFSKATTTEQKKDIRDRLDVLNNKAQMLAGSDFDKTRTEAEWIQDYAKGLISEEEMQKYLSVKGRIMAMTTMEEINRQVAIINGTANNVVKDRKGTNVIPTKDGSIDYGTFKISKDKKILSMTINGEQRNFPETQEGATSALSTYYDETAGIAVMEINFKEIDGLDYIRDRITQDLNSMKILGFNLGKLPTPLDYADAYLKSILIPRVGEAEANAILNDPNKKANYIKGSIIKIPADKPNLQAPETGLAPGVAPASSLEIPPHLRNK